MARIIITRIFTTLFCLFVLTTVTAQKAKYVFLMIGDGMGVNQVGITERYMAAVNGSNGRVPLCMTQFPALGLAHTYSKSYGTTDSAAGGTALSTGQKTTNGTIAMDSAKAIPVASIAAIAKEKGMAVGVTTSVSIDHATPAVFYAHSPNRRAYYEIGCQLPMSGYDFFGGAWFLKPTGNDGKQPCIDEMVANAGYATIKGYNEYQKHGRSHDKVILTQEDERAKQFKNSLPYAIDRDDDDLQLPQITAAAIDFLYNKSEDKGFFLMVEGGQIDWACHSNDAGAAVIEVVDFDKAINEAYKFYLQHPDETLIVVSADHETGGLSPGRDGKYDLQLQLLGQQKCSQFALTKKILAALNDKENAFSYDAMKKLIAENTGLWGNIEMTETDEAEIKAAYDKTIQGNAKGVESEYFTDEQIAVAALKVLNRKAFVGWTTGSHTSTFVPVFAVGVGAERFSGVIENTDIPKNILEIMCN